MHRGRTGVALLVVTGLFFAVLAPALPVLAATGDPVITSSPPPSGQNRIITWSFTGGGGGQTSCRLTGSSSFDTSYVDCNSSASYDLAGQPDGTYTFAVRNQPASSNNGEVGATSTYVLDTTAAVSITASPSPNPGNQRNVSWSFSSEPGATFACQLSPGPISPPAFTSCASPQSYALGTDGEYSFAVRATDLLGNISPTTTATYRLDVMPPDTPEITSLSPANDTTPTWILAAEPGARVDCQLSQGATVVSSFAACTSATSATYTLTSDGTYTLSVRATDAAGNTSGVASSSYILDTVAPPPPVIGRGPSSPGTDPSPTWWFTTESVSTAECQFVSGSTVVAGWAPCSGPRSYQVDAENPASYTFSVRAIDAAGNTSPATSATYVVGPAATKSQSLVPPPDVVSPADTASPSSSPPPPPAAAAAAPSPPPGPITPALSPLLTRATPVPFTLVEQQGPASVVPAFTGTPAPSSPVTAVSPGLIEQNRAASLLGGSRPETAPTGQPRTEPPAVPAPSELDASEQAVVLPTSLPPPGAAGTAGVADAIREVGLATVKKTAFPFFLLLIVLMFLLIQDRIDRRDPKLALAPVYRDPDLDFEPPPSRWNQR